MWGPSDSEFRFMIWTFAIGCGIVGFTLALMLAWVF